LTSAAQPNLATLPANKISIGDRESANMLGVLAPPPKAVRSKERR